MIKKDHLMPKKGVVWRPVQAKSLSEKSRKLYGQYVHKLEEANALGRQLKEAVTGEWSARYPDGINGQVCAFNAINGVLQYVMKPKKKTRAAAKQAFDENSGDDVFSSPPIEPQATSKDLGVSKEAKPNPLKEKLAIMRAQDPASVSSQRNHEKKD